MTLDRAEFSRLTSRLGLALLCYAWLAGYTLGQTLAMLALFALTPLSYVAPIPLLAMVAGPLALGVKTFTMAFAFAWLSEAQLVEGALVAWLGAVAAAALEALFQGGLSGLSLPPVWALVIGAVQLVASSLGVWCAEANSWRPGLKYAREMAFTVIVVP